MKMEKDVCVSNYMPFTTCSTPPLELQEVPWLSRNGCFSGFIIIVSTAKLMNLFSFSISSYVKSVCLSFFFLLHSANNNVQDYPSTHLQHAIDMIYVEFTLCRSFGCKQKSILLGKGSLTHLQSFFLNVQQFFLFL